MRVRILHLPSLTLAILAHTACLAEHDIEYVAEHLPEAAMDNRYAALPFWGGSLIDASLWQVATQAAYTSTQVGSLSLEGPMLSASLQREITKGWQMAGFGFYDVLSLASQREYRPLQTLFAPMTPIDRPVDAVFSDLDGRMTHVGAGLVMRCHGDGGIFGKHRWVAGVQWERIALRDYSLNYELLSGPQSGLRGSIDFDTDYDHLAPFVGLELPRDLGRWTFAFHALIAYPLPRRGIVGHINGPSFDLAGDTADAGNGKHFGDPSLTIGWDVTYRPAGLTFDVGTMLSQWLLEPLIHPGIDKNLILSVSWRPE
jgi:hypothetical protein